MVLVVVSVEERIRRVSFFGSYYFNNNAFGNADDRTAAGNWALLFAELIRAGSLADAKAAVCFGDRQAAVFSWQKILIGKITQCLLQDKLVVPGDAYNGIAVRSSAA